MITEQISPTVLSGRITNSEIALAMRETADLLEAQQANPFRVNAYRRAAESLMQLSRPVVDILSTEGIHGLTELPGIGPSLAAAIEHLILVGDLPLLEQLRGDTSPERVFTTVAGIGPELAARIHQDLGIETLAELETAACDGTLRKVAGMGNKRIAAVRESLAGRFRRPAASPVASSPKTKTEQPPVSELLDIDREYRQMASQGKLTMIAPKRMNPEGKAWLPILHTHRGERHYTALFSNTAHAHEMRKTHDWVVIFRDDHDGHGQWTVITSTLGKLTGRRIVRGREADCREFYGAKK
jgi:hypothetical protein